MGLGGDWDRMIEGKKWDRDDLRGRVGGQVGLRHDKNRQGRDVITKDGERGRNKGNNMG